MGSRVTEFLGQTEVDDVDEVSFLGQAHQEVVGLYVTMNEVLRVDVFDTTDLEQVKKLSQFIE